MNVSQCITNVSHYGVYYGAEAAICFNNWGVWGH